MTPAAEGLDVEQVSLFLALLAILAELTVAAVLVLAVTARVRPAARGPLRALHADVRPLAVPLALLVAVVATSGSLYYSEVAHFPPCRLCWWQRGFMYPQVLLLAVAALRPRWRLWRVALPLTSIGTAIAAYHAVIERWPTLEVTSCALTNPCTLRWVEELGYLTIPLMSLSAFVLVDTLLVLAAVPVKRSR